MKEEMKISPEFVSGLKEVARTAMFAAIPNLIVFIQTQEFDNYLLFSSISIAILSGISEMLHKLGKTKEKETGVQSALLTGLSRF